MRTQVGFNVGGLILSGPTNQSGVYFNNGDEELLAASALLVQSCAGTAKKRSIT